MITAIEFFAAHASLCLSPGETEPDARMRGARELAAAESRASERGYSFEWSIDPDCDSSDWSSGPIYSAWECAMRDVEGAIVGTLCGIDFGPDGDPWGDPYRRVVEAEMALGGVL